MDKITRKAQIVVATSDASGQNKFLLLKTNESRGHFWQNSTGRVEDGESYEQGAIREVIEETQLHPDNIIKVIDLDRETSFHDRWNRNVSERAYLIVVRDLWEVKIDPEEHDDFKWVELSELKEGCVKYSGNLIALISAAKILQGQS